MATISMPKKDKAAEPEIVKATQTRPALSRYRLQVDRQTKSTFAVLDDAKAAGQAIKKAYPIVQVSIYDAEQSATVSID